MAATAARGPSSARNVRARACCALSAGSIVVGAGGGGSAVAGAETCASGKSGALIMVGGPGATTVLATPAIAKLSRGAAIIAAAWIGAPCEDAGATSGRLASACSMWGALRGADFPSPPAGCGARRPSPMLPLSARPVACGGPGASASITEAKAAASMALPGLSRAPGAGAGAGACALIATAALTGGLPRLPA